MQQTIAVEVYGRVQGVGFRYFVYRMALRHRMSGWVRNTMRGTVEALVRGDAESLAQLRDELQRGPSLSRVDRIVWQPLTAEDLRSTADDELIDGHFELRP